MKTALIRILTIATLATSVSAFAATDETKHSDAATASATSQQEGCSAAHKEKKQKNAKPQRNDDRTEQEKEFDHVLMGYYGWAVTAAQHETTGGSEENLLHCRRRLQENLGKLSVSDQRHQC
jgi:hypothetical protein